MKDFLEIEENEENPILWIINKSGGGGGGRGVLAQYCFCI